MAVKVLDYHPPKIDRFESGLFSLDRACSSASGEMGLPLRSIYEVYGRPGVGKSSLIYFLLGRNGRLRKDPRIDICDIEILDPDYVVSSLEHAEYDGQLNFISGQEGKKKETRSHESMIEELQSNLSIDKVACCALDSIGAIVPIAEAEGDIGEANMGRRAKAVAQFARKAVISLRDLEMPKNLYVVNHVNAVIGGRGHSTPGGDELKFLAAVRLMIWQDEVITNSKGDAIAFVSKGVVEKLRYGGKGKNFKFVVIPGYGVSKELTALVDCVDLGLATRKTVVKVGEESIGYLSKLVESAQSGYSKTFQPFFDALNTYKKDSINVLTTGETDSYDESTTIEVHSSEGE